MYSRLSMRNSVCSIVPLVLIFTLFAFSPANHVILQTRKHHLPHYHVQMITNISYGPFFDENLDQCTPVGAPSSRPGIIMIHGGGWTGGDKTQYSTMCSNYAAEGYDVTTINYRLTPKYQWPTQIGDVQLAVRWMRANAASMKLNPNNICALGDSAGAHLALLLDELQTIHPSDVGNIYPNISPTVQCVVDQFGPTDLAQLYNENPPVRHFIYDLMDSTVPPNPMYTDASPLDNISPRTGPALIIQGTQDQVVLPNQSQELQQAFQNDGIPVQYISYIGGHEYSGLTQHQFDVIMSQIQNFLNSFEQP
jgi:acetyl esterase/lipase